MNVVDSSAWLEYFADGPNARTYAPPITKAADLLVPTVVVYEVFKRLLQQRGETDALRAVAYMERGTVVDVDKVLALAAARLSVDTGLPLADSMILATARQYGATLWTQDADFEGHPDVKYVPRRPL